MQWDSIMQFYRISWKMTSILIVYMSEMYANTRWQYSSSYTQTLRSNVSLTLSLSVTAAPSSSNFSTILCLLSRDASIKGVKPLSWKRNKNKWLQHSCGMDLGGKFSDLKASARHSFFPAIRHKIKILIWT